MSFSLSELAQVVGGRLVGDGDLQITGAATLREARHGDISLATDNSLATRLARSQASAFVVPHQYEPRDVSYIAVDNVAQAFAAIVSLFRPPRSTRRIGISPAAHIHPEARLGENVDVYPGAVIDEDVEVGDGTVVHPGVHLMPGCRIGRDVTLFSNAVLYENTVVGDRSILHAGVVIGCYGFGYDLVEGRHLRGSQLGNVVIGNDVEIGAATTIDRGTYGPTIVGDGTKIDNQVMIGHNCQIGRHNLLCSQVGIAGSTSTGDYVVMAGQVGVADHLHIGDRAVLGAKAGVMTDVPDGVTYLGVPAGPERTQKQLVAAYWKLPELRKQLKLLQKAVDCLCREREQSAESEVA